MLLGRAFRARLAIALLFAGVPLVGEPPKGEAPFLGRFMFRTYAQEDGIKDPSIECVLQDRSGFLWAGTDDGLFRFDGRRFQKFGREQGLPQTRIYQLHQAADGRFYAGTAAGLAKLHGGRFTVIDAKAGLGPVAVSHQGIASDADGTVYVGTDRGLFSGRNDVYAPDKEANAFGEGPVGAVHVDPAGGLYFARGGFLFRKESDSVVEFGRPRGLPTDETLDTVESDHAGRLWVRTVKHLYVLNKGAQKFEREDEGLPESSEVGRLELDDRGEILLPTVLGLAFRQDGFWRLIGRREGLASDAALSALVDREGSLWIGLLGGGLDRRLGRGELTNWTRSDGLSQEVVWSIVRQKVPSGSGPIWVGTEQGLNRIDPATGDVRHLDVSDGLGGNTISALAAGADGSVWIGSWPGGVTRLAPDGKLKRYGAADVQADRGGSPRSTSAAAASSGSAPSRGSTASARARPPPCSNASRSAARSPTACGSSPRIRPGICTPPAARVSCA